MDEIILGKNEIIIAGAMNDAAIPGKAVVRVGDSLTLADAAAGGLDAIRNGTSFAGEGFTVSVAPASGTQLNVSWSPPLNDNGMTVTKYKVEWDGSAGVSEVQQVHIPQSVDAGAFRSTTSLCPEG